ncbi:DUF6519 domain-containing protein [Streptomyces pseudovenezuelae]|uniref:Baseplate protein J-like domain-containing protein n=1 Tax=Streptomyces pseudovenezuelae TaxID=67350 RepID=A0ABT6LDB3_9ACTN|nr:DUF6519 domain-containing protein [Streptomyces pseudovenezuelae]MDH6214291.1 hypothetical protein [Streptomyces pseudovenezuelae]
MGDFSRSTFDRVKHYVGIRLQQGVPLVDADWNELEDIRRFEVEAFLKWFVGDGVPAGNDGFRIVAAAGGGVGTIRLTPAATGTVGSSVSVDVTASTVATALGFTQVNRQAARGLAPARLTGDAVQPFALTAGMTLVVSANGAPPQTVTFTASGFADLGAATAAEVAAVINAAANRVVASAGTGNDFFVAGGDGTPEGAGRCLADGRDAVHEGRLAYSSQPLYANTALAAAWGVPVVQELAAPTSGTRSDLVYLDVWDREVTSAEDDTLLDPLVGVETCVRVRREWAVRVRPGATQPPVPNDTDYVSGHSYLQLARIGRQSGVASIRPPALIDLRPRNLQVPPSTLVDDVLGSVGGDSSISAAYRKGQRRPRASLRDAINALLAGQLPPSPEISVSPSDKLDVLNRASVVDAAGGLVAVWQAERSGSKQILAARLDPARPDLGFALAPALTTGGQNIEPAAVALPGGDLLVAYQNGSLDGPNTDVLMKRGPLATLGAATPQNVAATGNQVADQRVRAVLAGDQVVFFTHQSSTTLKQWYYRRYRHTDNVFLDPAPVALSETGLTQRDLHAASADGKVWVAYPDGTKIQILRFNPVPAGTNPQGPPVIDLRMDFPAPGQRNVFVLALSGNEVLVFYEDDTGLIVVSGNNGTWTSTRVPDSDTDDAQPAAVRDADGTVYLVSNRPAAGGSELLLRRRDVIGGNWIAAQRLVASTQAQLNFSPHPVLVPDLGLWLLWVKTLGLDSDVYAKQIITAI